PQSQTTSKQTISKFSERRSSTRVQKCWFPVRVCWDTDKLGLRFGPLEEQEGGLPVRNILKASWAHGVRLKPGDWLISINGDAVAKMREDVCFELLQRHRPLRLLFARKCLKSATPKLKRPNKIAVKLDEAILYSKQHPPPEPISEQPEHEEEANAEEAAAEEVRQNAAASSSSAASADEASSIPAPTAAQPNVETTAQPTGGDASPQQAAAGEDAESHGIAEASPVATSTQDHLGSTVFSDQYGDDEWDDFEPEDSFEEVETQPAADVTAEVRDFPGAGEAEPEELMPGREETDLEEPDAGTLKLSPEAVPAGTAEAEVEDSNQVTLKLPLDPDADPENSGAPDSPEANSARESQAQLTVRSSAFSEKYDGDWDDEFEGEEEAEEATEQHVTFDPEVETAGIDGVEASGKAPRQGTGFVRMTDLPDDDEDDESEAAAKNVTFSP
ncbi:unnamed protein product, partial [Symbiodinium pilosum]